MARDQKSAAKGSRIAATAKAVRRTAKARGGKATRTPPTDASGASGGLPLPADISQDVLHGRARPAIYAAVTKRLRS